MDILSLMIFSACILMVWRFLKNPSDFIRPFIYTRSRDDYVRLYPRCQQGGEVSCFRCRGSHIVEEQLFKGRAGALYSYCCRYCEIELFQATHG